MKLSTLFAAIAAVGLVGQVQAGLFHNKVSCGTSCGTAAGPGCGSEKSCGCAPSCQPIVCKPIICRPKCWNTYTYQRQGCCKPGCGDAGPSCGRGCGPACGTNGPACGTNGPACATTGPNCSAPAACGPACGPTCSAPAACGPACAPTCSAPAACGPAAGPTCSAPAACGPACGAGPNCAAPACGAAPCVEKQLCCNADPCKIANLIFISQTACYAKQRRAAISRLGHFDCRCNPEIMCAFIYGLNDSDERVRLQAADEILCQLRKHPCCCNEKLTTALMYALADCHRPVRRKVERALEQCGFDVRKCCDEVACGTPACGAPACGVNGCGVTPPVGSATAPAPTTAPEPVKEDAGAAVPMPEEPTAPAPAAASVPAGEETYFPARLKSQQGSTQKKSLSNLFGLRS